MLTRRKVILAIISAPVWAGVRLETSRAAEPGGENRVPSVDELPKLREGLKIVHSPNPAMARKGGPSGKPYTWEYATTVSSTVGPVKIVEFGGLVRRHGVWVFSNYTGKPYTSKDFAEWYSCPDAKIEDGKKYTDPRNWQGSDILVDIKTRWYYIGVTASGERVKGDGLMEHVGQLRAN